MAGSDNFTGQNIQDTYQRVLQLSSSGQLADGTGSLVELLNVTASFAVSASHEITFETSSSYAQTASAAENDFNIASNLNFDSTAPQIFAGGDSMMVLQSTGGQIIVNKDLRTGDNQGIKFGAGSDYTIKHNSSAVGETKMAIVEGASTRYTFGIGGHLSASAGVNIHLGAGVQGGGEFRGESANILQVTSSIISASSHIHTSTLKGGGDEVSLNVLGAITASGNISASGTGSFSDGRFAEKVGIGTTSPSEKLHIYGNVNDDVKLKIENDFSGKNAVLVVDGGSSGDAIIHLAEASSVKGIITYDGGTDVLKIINDGSTGTEHFAMDTSGNVGIGTFSPTEKLQVAGNISASGDIIGVTGSFDYVKTDKLQVGTTGGTDILSIDGGDLQLENNKQITFSDIGDGNTGRVRIVGNEDDDFIRMHVDNSNSHVLTLNTTGVGIGTTSPVEKLTVIGNISASGNITTTEITTSGNISSSGNVIAEYYDASQGATGYKLNNSKVIYVDDSSRVFGNRVTVTKISGSSIRLGTPGDSAHVTASGNISASGTVEALGYSGVPVVLLNNSEYLGSATSGDRFYYGNNTQGLYHTMNNFISVAPETGVDTSLNQGAQHNSFVVPFDVKDIEFRASVRLNIDNSQGAFWIAKKPRQDGGASFSDNFLFMASGSTIDNATIGASKFYNCDITGSHPYVTNMTASAGEEIYIFWNPFKVNNNTDGSESIAQKWTWTLSGKTSL